MLERGGMRRTRLYRTIVVVGATLAGGAIAGSTSTLTGCELYFEPTPTHHGSAFGIIDAPFDSYWIIDATIEDSWHTIADAPSDGGVTDAS